MSEYQYYEFQKLDGLLTETQIDKLRNISTRAKISPTSFTNFYTFGNGLKANTLDLMDHYFDAHLYFANWGSRDLRFKIPKDLISLKKVMPFNTAKTLKIRTTEKYVHFEFVFDIEPEYCEPELQQSLSSLIHLRQEILEQDYRCLYLAWLKDVSENLIPDYEFEPPVPDGLNQLSRSQTTFVEFLEVGPDLLLIATENSRKKEEISKKDLENWINAFSREEKNNLLYKVATKKITNPSQYIISRFLARDTNTIKTKDSIRRTALEMLTGAEKHKKERLRKKAELADKERIKRKKEEARKRTEYLGSLKGKVPTIWEKIEGLVQTSKSKEYDVAVKLLVDLNDFYNCFDTRENFRTKLQWFYERYKRKPALIRRLKAKALAF